MLKYFSYFILILKLSVFAFDINTLDPDNQDIILSHYRQNPVDLNHATLYELLAVPFLDEKNAMKINNYLLKGKQFTSLNQLLNLISKDCYIRIKEFIIINGKEDETGIDLFQQIQMPYFKSKGFKDSIYLGSPLRNKSKIRLKINNFIINFLASKEIGEIDFSSNYKLNFSTKSKSYRIILGDFNFYALSPDIYSDLLFFSHNFFGYGLKRVYSNGLSRQKLSGLKGIVGEYRWRNYSMGVHYGEKQLAVKVNNQNQIISIKNPYYLQTANDYLLKRAYYINTSGYFGYESKFFINRVQFVYSSFSKIHINYPDKIFFCNEFGLNKGIFIYRSILTRASSKYSYINELKINHDLSKILLYYDYFSYVGKLTPFSSISSFTERYNWKLGLKMDNSWHGLKSSIFLETQSLSEKKKKYCIKLSFKKSISGLTFIVLPQIKFKKEEGIIEDEFQKQLKVVNHFKKSNFHNILRIVLRKDQDLRTAQLLGETIRIDYFLQSIIGGIDIFYCPESKIQDNWYINDKYPSFKYFKDKGSHTYGYWEYFYNSLSIGFGVSYWKYFGISKIGNGYTQIKGNKKLDFNFKIKWNY